MRVGARGHDINVSDVNEILNICKKHNIKGLQLVVNKTWEELYNKRDLEEICNKIKALQVGGVEIYLLGTYFNPVHPNKKSLSEGLEKVKFNIEIANKCGLKYLGSETGSVNGDEWTYNPENHNDINFNKVTEVFSSFKDDIQNNNLNFLVEAVYDHVIYSGDRLKYVLEEIDSENYKITFDLANLLNVDNYKNYEKIAEEFLENHHNKIRLMHLKNFVIEDNKKIGVKLDSGLLNYDIVLQLIKRYKLTDVPCIIEELDGDNLMDSIDYIQKLWRENEL